MALTGQLKEFSSNRKQAALILCPHPNSMPRPQEKCVCRRFHALRLRIHVEHSRARTRASPLCLSLGQETKLHLLQVGHKDPGPAQVACDSQKALPLATQSGQGATVVSWFSRTIVYGSLCVKFLSEDSALASGFSNNVANAYIVFKNPKSVSTDIVQNSQLIGGGSIVCYYTYTVNVKQAGAGD